jgi:GTP-binding protein EngB required for normal cell division
MGNNNNIVSFYMHIKIIGSNMNKFYNELRKSSFLRNIINYWAIDELKTLNEENLNQYFDYLNKEKEKKTINLREVLIIKLNNFDSEVKILLDNINPLSQTYYMPLVLILTEDSHQKLEIDTDEYDDIDPRLFFVAKYTEEPERLEKEIFPLLLRFCSFHNELGDIFSVGKENNEERFDLIEKNFPFNLNIACVGRIGQGKSTGVNALLNEYKAKESELGASQTKNLTFYQVKNNPIRILDIPGFEDEKSVQKCVEQFKLCGKKINSLKDKIHIILYFLNYNGNRAFTEGEYPMIEEITKHKKSKILYVFTHSNSKINEKIKNRKIEEINTGIQKIAKLPEQKEMFKADNNNVIFVNFHKNRLTGEEPFGKEELFKKIYEVFIESEEYKSSLEKLTKEKIEKAALKLRAEAQKILRYNKIGGGAIGWIPMVDWIVTKYLIKKNAMKKVGEIFGIDVKFIDEENAKKEKEKDDDLSYIYEIDGEKELEESSIEKEIGTKEAGKITAQGFGGTYLYIASTTAKEALKLSAEATQLTTKAAELSVKAGELTAKATQLAIDAKNEAQNMNLLTKIYYYVTQSTSKLSQLASSVGTEAAQAVEAANSASISAANAGAIAAETESFTNLCTLGGIGGLAFGCILGIVLGGYFTHKFCEELLDQFVDYYKNNADKVVNSYKNAAEYFLENNEKK